jgi:ketosteroid isomerase-like protein
MKKIGLMSFVLVVALAVAMTAQAPAGGGAPAGAPGGGRGQGGGGGGRGAGGGGRGAGTPVAPPALQAFADGLAAAINKQDAAALTKMTAMDAVYLDEDGHAPPISAWIMNLTSGTPAKTFTIAMAHGQMLDDNSAWVSFNYTLTGSPRGGAKPLTGTASLALKKVGNDWMIAMVHGALKQSVAGVTQ